MQGFLRAFLQSGRQRHRASYPERHHHPGHPSYGSGKPGSFHETVRLHQGKPPCQSSCRKRSLGTHGPAYRKVPEDAPWRHAEGNQGRRLLGIEKDINVLFKEIEHYLELGYHRTKIKIHPGRDIEVVKAIRKEFGDITLTVDANSAYTLKDIDLFRAMDEYHLQYIEQPLGEEDIVDHATLQKAIETPVCLDESIVSYEAAEVAIRLGSCKVINIKSSRCGGVYEGKRIHDLCVAHHIPVWCGGMTELGIGRAQNVSFISLPGFTELAHDVAAASRYFDEDVTNPMVDITDRCTIIVPDEENGIHYDVDEKQIDKMEAGHWIFK